jgi:alkaline phosphatase D
MNDEDDKPLARRELLRGAGAAVLTLGAAACSSDEDIGRTPDDGLPRYSYAGPLGPETLFQHGVASGDPLPDAVILWTRVTPATPQSLEVWWEIAADPQFSARLQVGTFVTDPERDFTVKVDVTGLEPGRTFYYRFFALGRRSPIGRTRTAPAGAVSRLRFAVASCSSLAHGYFHGYRAIAERAELDAVIHLGDYIYEYASGGYGNVRPYEPEHEAVTLADYRARHAQYKRDPDLQEAHRQHPFICVWDDHETADNAWQDGARNHQPETEGSWQERKAAGTRAWAEWLPIREQPDGRIFRKLAFGTLVDLVLLDTRLWGRNRLELGVLGPPPAPDPERSLLGDDQADWLERQLAESRADWKLIGQQVMVGNIVVSPGASIANLDQWQGYPESRRRLLEFLAMGVKDVVILTGDIHSSWANEIVSDPNDPALYDPETGAGSLAVEFVTPGITSPGLEGVTEIIESLRPVNPHVRFIDPTRRGYMVLDVDSERAQAAWYLYDDVSSPEPTAAAFAAAWSVPRGSTRLSDDGVAAEPPGEFAEPAPAEA